MKALAILLFTCLVPVLAQANKCAKQFGDPKAKEEFEFQVDAFQKKTNDLISSYSERLFPNQNPFASAFTYELTELVFERLSRRAYEDKWIQSPMAQVNNALKDFHVGDRNMKTDLVEWVLEDSEFLLDDDSSDYDQRDYQSNLVALRFLDDYLRRFKAPAEVVDREGQTEAEKVDEKQEEQGEEQTDEAPDEPPEYPELLEEYKPQTNDTDNSGAGKSPKQYRIAETNFKTPFFAQRYFSEVVRGAVHAFSQANLPTVKQVPSRSQNTGKELKINTYGKLKVDLFLPPSHKPLQPTDPRAKISRSEKGVYVLELQEELNQIRIPLKEETGVRMLPHEKEIYTRPVGFEKSEWPDAVQIEIFRKFPEEGQKDNPLKVSWAIADLIATEYLYSVDAKPETDPIAAMNAGAFQCDLYHGRPFKRRVWNPIKSSWWVPWKESPWW